MAPRRGQSLQRRHQRRGRGGPRPRSQILHFPRTRAMLGLKPRSSTRRWGHGGLAAAALPT
eukprot:11198552-Lingulodinium_polyedra.AAC.1